MKAENSVAVEGNTKKTTGCFYRNFQFLGLYEVKKVTFMWRLFMQSSVCDLISMIKLHAMLVRNLVQETFKKMLSKHEFCEK